MEVSIFHHALMLLVDLTVFSFTTSLAKYSLDFLSISSKNKKEHEHDVVSQLHFQEHVSAVVIQLVGSTIAALGSFVHILDQHFLGSKLSYSIEITESVGFILIALSSIIFLNHMKKEETPGHPFFMREYGFLTKIKQKPCQ